MNLIPPPAGTPAPIHDITGPLWVFPHPWWVVALAIVGVSTVVGFLVWLIKRKRPARPLTPREKALAVIAEFRTQDGGEPYPFAVRVSDALRAYIRDQHGLDAVTRTSVEFLEALRDNPAFTAAEKDAVAEFLESADLLKYARIKAGGDEIRALLDIAERLIRGGAASTPSVT